MKQQSIAILIPYFGRWPEFMELYLESCQANQLIDILFVTDLPPVAGAPSNVKFVPMSFEQLKKRIEDKFTLKLPEIKPYKLCDYRPAYGLIFQEELEGYGFWGYGDNDLVYGDLNVFLTEEVLENHDIFAFRKDHLHGPFTLYRNSEATNHLFEKSDQFRDIFLNLQYLSFDEFGTESFHVDPQLDLSRYSNDNISVIALKEAAEGRLRLYMKAFSKELIYQTKDIIAVEKGKVYNYKTREQYSFYHWVLEKRAVWFKYPRWENIPARYYVSETGFYTESQFRFYAMIHAVRMLKGTIYWVWLKCTNYLKRKTGFKVTLDTYPRTGFVKSI